MAAQMSAGVSNTACHREWPIDPWHSRIAVCFCVGYVVWLRKRQQEEDLAALAAAHSAGDTMGRKGNMDMAFLRQVRMKVVQGHI